jgi:hypothetical protein
MRKLPGAAGVLTETTAVITFARDALVELVDAGVSPAARRVERAAWTNAPHATR